MVTCPASALQDYTLAKLYEQGAAVARDLSTSTPPQAEVASGVACLKRALALVDSLGLFSPNEDKEDIATVDLKYLLTRAYLSELLAQLAPGEPPPAAFGVSPKKELWASPEAPERPPCRPAVHRLLLQGSRMPAVRPCHPLSAAAALPPRCGPPASPPGPSPLRTAGDAVRREAALREAAHHASAYLDQARRYNLLGPQARALASCHDDDAPLGGLGQSAAAVDATTSRQRKIDKFKRWAGTGAVRCGAMRALIRVIWMVDFWHVPRTGTRGLEGRAGQGRAVQGRAG